MESMPDVNCGQGAELSSNNNSSLAVDESRSETKPWQKFKFVRVSVGNKEY